MFPHVTLIVEAFLYVFTCFYLGSHVFSCFNLLKEVVIGIAYCGHFEGSTDANFQSFREDQTEHFIIHWETSNRKRVDVVANSLQPP